MGEMIWKKKWIDEICVFVGYSELIKIVWQSCKVLLQSDLFEIVSSECCMASFCGTS